MSYPCRPGLESERLALIWETYQWCASPASGHLYAKNGGFGNTLCNKVREIPIAYDLAHIFAAIAGGYVIELSPHWKGIQLVRKNKKLWERVSKFVKLAPGQGCLPYDEDSIGERWEHINGVSFFQEP